MLPAATEIFTLSLHDALPISNISTLTVSGGGSTYDGVIQNGAGVTALTVSSGGLTLASTNTYTGATNITGDRKSTRLNSSHRCISYAVFCLKKKRKERSKVPQ